MSPQEGNHHSESDAFIAIDESMGFGDTDAIKRAQLPDTGLAAIGDLIGRPRQGAFQQTDIANTA